MRLICVLLLFLVLPLFSFAQPETEPNGSFETANLLSIGTPATGSLNNFTSGGVTIDGNDYFMAIFPEDGTVDISVSGTNTRTNNAYLFIYIYDSRKAPGLLSNKYTGNTSVVPSGGSVNDVIRLHGRAADTLYFRLITSATFSYRISYAVSDKSTNDAEPNDDINQVVSIDRQQTKEGHIGYVKAGADDASDYYRAVLPYEGTLTIYVQGRNRWGSNGYLYMYGYDRRKLAESSFQNMLRTVQI